MKNPLLPLIALFCICCSQHLAHAEEEQSPRIVNLVNFIRGVEPRGPVDLVEPLREQLRLGKAFGLPTTYLIQYDALLRPEIVTLLKEELGPNDEIGAWIEVVQPQVEAAGLEWKGRFPWDWHTDVGFTVGYTPEQRYALMDEYMSKFEETFGYLPTSVGCWIIDAPTLNYLADEYHITAATICKDQSGTDGYTLWGGYWSGAYYPSRKNAFMPAQTREQQLDVPVFRMLGSDPIYQYDTGLGGNRQGVISLEPVYGESGGSPHWVRWFFDTYWNAPCLGFSYAQAGQENSFGWRSMSRGLEFQYPMLAGAALAGDVRVETLAESAAWFRETFETTPATAVVALSDWRNTGQKAIWYESAHYRVSFGDSPEGFRVRDIHLFDENYPGRYLEERVDSPQATFDTLPILDSFNWSDRNNEKRAGIRLVVQTTDGTYEVVGTGDPTVSEIGKDSLLIHVPIQTGGEMTIHCSPEGMVFTVDGDSAPEQWALEFYWAPTKATGISRIAEESVTYRHNDYQYELQMSDCEAQRDTPSSFRITPNDDHVNLDF